MRRQFTVYLTHGRRPFKLVLDGDGATPTRDQDTMVLDLRTAMGGHGVIQARSTDGVEHLIRGAEILRVTIEDLPNESDIDQG